MSRNGSSGEHRTDGADKVRGHRVLLGEPSSQESIRSPINRYNIASTAVSARLCLDDRHNLRS